MTIGVLFVCLGNICRSPLAEGLFKEKVSKKHLTKAFQIDSAGTGGYHIGSRPDTRMLSTAFEKGLRLDSKARKLIEKDFDRFDYIIAMDESNLSHIQSMIKSENKAKIYLMRNFDEDDGELNVPDPYFGGQAGFEDVYRILDRCTDALLDYVIKKNNIAR